MRGADLLDSTPRQILLQELLGLPRVRYAHLPLALDDEGRKLSKQERALAVDADDPLPALRAALAFLGQAAMSASDGRGDAAAAAAARIRCRSAFRQAARAPAPFAALRKERFMTAAGTIRRNARAVLANPRRTT